MYLDVQFLGKDMELHIYISGASLTFSTVGRLVFTKLFEPNF